MRVGVKAATEFVTDVVDTLVDVVRPHRYVQTYRCRALEAVVEAVSFPGAWQRDAAVARIDDLISIYGPALKHGEAREWLRLARSIDRARTSSTPIPPLPPCPPAVPSSWGLSS